MKHFVEPANSTPVYEVADLERWLSYAAQVVTRHGEKYLPIYIRLERELDEARRNNDIMARVRRAARLA